MPRPALIEKLFQPNKWLFRKEYIPLDDLVGYGLKVLNQKLNVDFSDVPADRLRQIVMALILENGGLAADDSGKLYVDFTKMDMDRFNAMIEEFRKSLRLQKWLTANTNFYVDKNHAAAADTLDEGRGLSPTKPFRTIQACVNYICDNYNIGSYQARIHIAAGTYDPLILGNFTYTTGSVYLLPEDGVIIKRTIPGYCLEVNAGNWIIDPIEYVYDVNFNSLSGTPYFGNGCIAATGGKVQIVGLNALVKVTGNNTSGRRCNMEGVSAGNSAEITISPSEKSQKLYMEIDNASTNNLNYYAFRSGNGGLLNLGDDYADGVSGNIECAGLFTVFAEASNRGSIIRGSTYEHKTAFTIASGKAVTGIRYRCNTGGTINTYNAGPEFFPGTTSGTVESSTYSWYK